ARQSLDLLRPVVPTAARQDHEDAGWRVAGSAQWNSHARTRARGWLSRIGDVHDAGVPKCSCDRACHFAPANPFLVDASRGHELEPTARNGDVDACSVTPYELDGGLGEELQRPRVEPRA